MTFYEEFLATATVNPLSAFLHTETVRAAQYGMAAALRPVMDTGIAADRGSKTGRSSSCIGCRSKRSA